MKPKPKKTIKQKQLIKVFEESRKFDQPKNNFSDVLFKSLVNLAISKQQAISHQEVKKIIEMIHSFTNMSKNLNQKKSIQNTSVSRYPDGQMLEDFSGDEIH